MITYIIIIQVYTIESNITHLSIILRLNINHTEPMIYRSYAIENMYNEILSTRRLTYCKCYYSPITRPNILIGKLHRNGEIGIYYILESDALSLIHDNTNAKLELTNRNLIDGHSYNNVTIMKSDIIDEYNRIKSISTNLVYCG